MEHAIETAVAGVKKKEEKKMKKKTTSGESKMVRMNSEVLLKAELQEGRKSPLLRRHQSCEVNNEKFQRREAVAERNETERQLVKEALKNFVKKEHIREYTF